METPRTHAASPCGTTAQEPLPPSVVERFWAKVDRRGQEDCWSWCGYIRAGGYGNFNLAGGVTTAHRASWCIAHGSEVPAGFMICHTCDNRRCVNPAHLWTGTAADNQRDRHAKRLRRLENIEASRELFQRALEDPRGAKLNTASTH